MKTDNWVDVMLPKHFHYHGMNKIKAGKGYIDGRPYGPLGGPCPECDGTIISIKMNTSAKGFETTSEKVCNKCGLVINGAFQVLEPKEPYKSRYYGTHEEWIEAMTPSDKSNEDVAWDAELYEHINGTRMNTSDNIGYGGEESGYKNKHDNNKRLGIAFSRLSKTPESMKISSSARMLHQQSLIVEDCAAEIGMSKFQIDEAKYIINKYGVKHFHRQRRDEDIIMCICLVVMSCYVNNGYMATIKRQLPMYNKRYKTLYQRIRDILV